MMLQIGGTILNHSVIVLTSDTCRSFQRIFSSANSSKAFGGVVICQRARFTRDTESGGGGGGPTLTDLADIVVPPSAGLGTPGAGGRALPPSAGPGALGLGS
eukprot:2452755-Alexandrium_andersonii.AAC.1